MRKRLKEYLPPVLLRTFEFPLICLVQQPEFDGIAAGADTVLDAQFVLTAGVIGLERYEAILDIIPGAKDTLEKRRAEILFRLNGQRYSPGWLIRKADEMFGAGNYQLSCDAQRFRLVIQTDISRTEALAQMRDEIRPDIPANLLLGAVAAAPVISIPETVGSMYPKSLRMRYRMRFYEWLVELDGQKRLDGSWKLGQVIPGFAFPQFQCVARIKHNYREQLIALDGSERLDGGWKLHQGYPAMRFITRFWNDDEGLQCAALEIGTAFQNPHGGMRKAALRFGAGYKNVITYSAPEMRFHARVTNRCGSMNGTLQKGIARKMDGTYQFNGAITFRKTQSIKEEL